jgi:hypothetical protein
MLTELRTCHRCETERPLDMFYAEMEARATARRGRPVRHACRVCQKAANERKTAGRRQYVRDLKIRHGCSDCGITSEHPEIFDFDHRPGETKIKSVAALITSGPQDALEAEIAKCDLVCANCHRIRTKLRQPVHYRGGAYV